MLNAMGLKYAADQELMQAHDQTCEERKKEDGDDTAAPFTRDPGTYEGCLAGPTSEKAREAAVAAMRAETQAKHVEERVRRRRRSIEKACGGVPTGRQQISMELWRRRKRPRSLRAKNTRGTNGAARQAATYQKCGKWAVHTASECTAIDGQQVAATPAGKGQGQGMGASGGKGGDGKGGTSVANVTATDETLYNAAGRTDRVALQLRLRRSQGSAEKAVGSRPPVASIHMETWVRWWTTCAARPDQ